MKNLEHATNNELGQLLTLSIGQALRLCSTGNEEGATQARDNALLIKAEMDGRTEVEK